MAASYPSSLPVKTPAGANLSTNPHSTLHDAMYDEIVAIATELGTTLKGTAASVKARLDSLPLGVVGYAERTATATGFTTTTADVSVSVTWTAESSRRYRITVQTAVISESGTQPAVVSITDGSNVLKTAVTSASATTTAAVGVSLIATETGLSGSVTRKLRAAAVTSTISVTASATSPTILLVEDIGAA